MPPGTGRHDGGEEDEETRGVEEERRREGKRKVDKGQHLNSKLALFSGHTESGVKYFGNCRHLILYDCSIIIMSSFFWMYLLFERLKNRLCTPESAASANVRGK